MNIELPGTIAFSSKKLQKKFKHAGDFGIAGDCSLSNIAGFRQAIEKHVADPETRVIEGTYRRQPARHYVNPWTRLIVIESGSRQFISGWKLSPAQLEHVFLTGKLGGG